MNIKITYNWLLEYLDTDADVYELQKYLSLCGPGVERIEKVENDYVMDIEVTSNRVDMASVIGIAREAQAILPQFGKKAVLRNSALDDVKKLNNDLKVSGQALSVQISDPQHLTNRIVAIVLDNVNIGKSPELICKRLEWCGIRSLKNIIDITNYVMLETGQPMHAFDYDRITSHTLLLRNAKENEILVTLDGKKHVLTETDIVIDDGHGTIIDLPGIMGTANSVITDNTKRVLLFTENNNSQKIRHTSMRLGIRTDAATINDKNPDPENALIGFLRSIQLFKEITRATEASELIDIYPSPYKHKTIDVALQDIERLMGIKLEIQQVEAILTNLGFKVENKRRLLNIAVPSWRANDIDIKEDIIEEVARVYGYQKLPNNISPAVHIKQPEELEQLFIVTSKLKYFLKHLGLSEMMNYSMISKEMLENFNLSIDNHLHLANTISNEIEYMRMYLMPSLIKNIADNQGKKAELRLFELSKTYLSQKNELPKEQYKLGITVNTTFADLKGILEAVFHELHIQGMEVRAANEIPILLPNVQAQVTINDKIIGHLGQLKPSYAQKLHITSDVFIVELDFQSLVNSYKILAPYKPINPHAAVKLDLTVERNNELSFAKMKKLALEKSTLLNDIELVDMFKTNNTLRFTFSAHDRNITEEEAKKELEKIVSSVDQ